MIIFHSYVSLPEGKLFLVEVGGTNQVISTEMTPCREITISDGWNGGTKKNDANHSVSSNMARLKIPKNPL